MKATELKNIQINDDFWTPYIDLVRETVIPYQWEALNDRVESAELSYAVHNFKVAAGLEKGEFGGLVFQDSDLAKWLEAVGYSLESHPDSKLEQIADEMIDIIAKAQQPDGYLDTYFIIKEPDKRWTNLYECHELYCAGHMIEAGVAYYKGTGKRKLLEVVSKLADHIDTVFGTEEGKIHGYPGHQEIELALVKLYEATGNEKYLRLSAYFLNERGKNPNFFTEEWEHTRQKHSYWSRGIVGAPGLPYNQSHKPVREQTEAVGHAVRAVYMYTGMASVAEKTGDKTLVDACKRLWDNITAKQMYITGGIGSTSNGEAFTFDYDLPNDTVYAETCASVGLIFFANKMLQIEPDANYADVMERALYNTVLAGMAKDGRHFFYVNPLEVWPKASHLSPVKHHVKPVRQKWFGCACCPPNVARLLSSLGKYVYSQDNSTIYTHLYISGDAEFAMNNEKVVLSSRTQYPWEGNVRFEVKTQKAQEFTLALRIPSFSSRYSLKINGTDARATVKKGYAYINRTWNDGDTIELVLDLPALLYQANPEVRADAGKVAIQRGPLVYCLEETDNGNNLSALSIPENVQLNIAFNNQLLGGIVTVTGNAFREEETGWEHTLYSPVKNQKKPVSFTAVPYYAWGNRTEGEMAVWIKKC